MGPCYVPVCEMDGVNPADFDSRGYGWNPLINTKNRSKYGIRFTGIDAGHLVQLFNDIDGPIDRTVINYEYYIQRAEKLVKQLRIVE